MAASCIICNVINCRYCSTFENHRGFSSALLKCAIPFFRFDEQNNLFSQSYNI